MPTRLTYSREFKTEVVLCALQSSKSQLEVAEEYGLTPQLISNWKQVFLKRASSVFDDPRTVSKPVSKSSKISAKRTLKRIEEPSTWLRKVVVNLSVSDRRLLVDRTSSISVAKQCDWLGNSRSGFDYTPKPENALNAELLTRINVILEKNPARGSRQLLADLAYDGIHVSRSRLRRLMSVGKKRTSSKQPKKTVMSSKSDPSPNRIRGVAALRPNHIWQTDITYIPQDGGFRYLMVAIDVYSRMVVGWSLSSNMTADWATQTIRQAVETWGTPQFVHSDRGTQFTSHVFRRYLRSLGTVSQSMIDRPLATENIYVERFFRSIKHECLYLRQPKTVEDIDALCEAYILMYNEERCHSAIGNVPPAHYFRRGIAISEGIPRLRDENRPK